MRAVEWETGRVRAGTYLDVRGLHHGPWTYGRFARFSRRSAWAGTGLTASGVNAGRWCTGAGPPVSARP